MIKVYYCQEEKEVYGSFQVHGNYRKVETYFETCEENLDKILWAFSHETGAFSPTHGCTLTESEN